MIADGSSLRMPGASRAVLAVLILTAVGALVFFSSRVAAEATSLPASLSGPATVVDGDSLNVAGEAIRVVGIDAPEARQKCRRASGESWPCGRAATSFLEQLTATGDTRCLPQSRDRYGRVLARCFVGEIDVGASIVRNGYAVAYRRYSDRYVAEEDAARERALGIWSGTFVEPERWRRGERAPRATRPAPTPAPRSDGECRIKGNISRSGRIYHVPGSRHYARTKIDLSKGERWFCSAAEAEAAGWRAPRGH